MRVFMMRRDAPRRALGTSAFLFACITGTLCHLGAAAERSTGTTEFVRISPRDSRYFELTDGQPYIPVGFNLVGPPASEDLETVVNPVAKRLAEKLFHLLRV